MCNYEKLDPGTIMYVLEHLETISDEYETVNAKALVAVFEEILDKALKSQFEEE